MIMMLLPFGQFQMIKKKKKQDYDVIALLD